MFFLAAAVAVTAVTGASAQYNPAGQYNYDAAPTPAPGYDDSYTQDMPYSWMTSEGYQSVDCGYGYNKDYSQHCTKADWYDIQGCYATTIIKSSECGPPETKTKTIQWTQTVTETQDIPVTVVVTEYSTDIQTQTVDVTQYATTTQILPTTRVWVSTDIVDQTETVEYTLTATETATKIWTYATTETDTQTDTDTETQTYLATVTQIYTKVVPTTYISVWESTVIDDQTNTVIETQSQTVTENQVVHETQTQYVTATDQVTLTEVYTLPTTIISTWIATQTDDNTQTVAVTMTSTYLSNVIQTQTWTDYATATVTDEVKDTSLSDCLNSCKSTYWNSWSPSQQDQMNHYEPAPPASSYGYGSY